MKISQVRKLIGKRVEWEIVHDHHRGTCIVRNGVVEDTKGRNVLISGNWEWLPSLVNLKEVEPKTTDRGSA